MGKNLKKGAIAMSNHNCNQSFNIKKLGACLHPWRLVNPLSSNKIGHKLSTTFIACSLVFLSACSSNFNQPIDLASLNNEFSLDSKEIFIVRADEEELARYQMMIATFSNLLTKEADTAEKRAEVLYQMALVYDRLELFATARNVMLTALVEIPDLASAYNFIGVYLATEGRFSEAYDAFDSAIELNEKDGFAYFNRGIALYYGSRSHIALPDLLAFYKQDINDPIRILWLYIVEKEILGDKEALTNLQDRQKAVTKTPDWGMELLNLYLGKNTLVDVVNNVKNAKISRSEQAQRLCEAYFYAAKLAQDQGKLKRAWDLFHLVLTTRAAGYIEYRYAQFEINKIEDTFKKQDLERQAIEQQKERETIFKEQLQKIIDSKKQNIEPAKTEPLHDNVQRDLGLIVKIVDGSKP